MLTCFVRTLAVVLVCGAGITSTTAQNLTVSQNPVVLLNIQPGDSAVAVTIVTNRRPEPVSVQVQWPTLVGLKNHNPATLALGAAGTPTASQPLRVVYAPGVADSAKGNIRLTTATDTMNVALDVSAGWHGPTVTTIPYQLIALRAVYGQQRTWTLRIQDMVGKSRTVSITAGNPQRWAISPSRVALAANGVAEVNVTMRVDTKVDTRDSLMLDDELSHSSIAAVIDVADELPGMALEYPWDTVRVGTRGTLAETTLPVVIRNGGATPFLLEYAMPEGPSIEQFHVGNPGLPYTIAPGDSAVLRVTYRPGSSENTASGHVWIMGAFNDTLRYEALIPVSGGTQTVTSVNGAEHASAMRLSCSPNPTATDLTVRLYGGLAAEQAEIVQAGGGQVLRNITVEPAAETEFRMDVRALPAGVYYVRVKSGEKMIVAPFVKQ